MFYLLFDFINPFSYLATSVSNKVCRTLLCSCIHFMHSQQFND